MPFRKRHESREQHRLIRSSTKQRTVLRPPAHLGRIIAITVAVIAVILLALGCGVYLKARSDAHRQAVEEGNWMLDEGVPPYRPISVPSIRAVAIRPEGNVGDILIGGLHGGVILPLQDGDGTLLYESDVAASAHLTMSASPVDLSDDVARIAKRGLNVTCVYQVTCFDTTNSAERTYRRGLDLALLREYAEGGMHDLLILGLPAGNDSADRLTVAFLQDLYALLSELPKRPAIGVALPASAFASDDTVTPTDPKADELAGLPEGTTQIYGGNITPARILNQCDYLAMDLRGETSEGVASVLPHIRYAYVRYSLRLLLSQEAPDAVEDALSHGFERLFEMEPPPAEPDTEEQP